MNIEEARAHVGKQVMSRDAGYKLMRRVDKPHGPYLLKQITKAGEAILEPVHGNPVAPSLLSPYNPKKNESKKIPHCCGGGRCSPRPGFRQSSVRIRGGDGQR